MRGYMTSMGFVPWYTSQEFQYPYEEMPYSSGSTPENPDYRVSVTAPQWQSLFPWIIAGVALILLASQDDKK